ncbi:MAG: hypothetical protein HY270_05685 [Deltaproteobacteria bacterium]|nr:hypothetical protein [Deltaproteobacteria bacterium]
MTDPTPTAPTSGILTSHDQERIRAEEQLRREIQSALAPPSREKSFFDKLIALLNTNVGIGTMAAVLLSVATWGYTKIDEHLHKADRKAAADSAKALIDVQHVSPFLPMLAKTGSPDRALACRVLAHMIASGAIDKTLGEGLAGETGSCVAEQVRQEAAAPQNGESRNATDTIRAVDRRESTERLSLSATVAEIENSNLVRPILSSAQVALARSLPRRVYIQYADDSQADLVKQLRKLCENKGWLTPPAERVGNKAPNELQVRYFNESDADAARQLHEDLRATAPFNQLAIAGEPHLLKLNAPTGQVEVWLPQPQ